jgi:hypothetical protein
MDLSLTELFVEIVVVGILYTFAVSSILIACAPDARRREGVLAGFNEWAHAKHVIVVAIAFVYAIGIAGNRIGWEIFKIVKIDTITDPNRVEIAVRDHGEIARDFVERHKTYLKVLRAASLSSVLYFLSMLLYRASIQEHQRYYLRHYIGALVLCLVFSADFYLENEHYSGMLEQYFKLVQSQDAKHCVAPSSSATAAH